MGFGWEKGFGLMGYLGRRGKGLRWRVFWLDGWGGGDDGEEDEVKCVRRDEDF